MPSHAPTAPAQAPAPTAAPGPRLTAPATVRAEAFVPDADQQRVLDLAPGHGPVLVLGGPGTGRSAVAVEYAARRIEHGLDPARLLVLAPTRQAAARLRDALSVRLDRAGRGTRAATPVRTWAAYAFDLVRRARVGGYLPTVQRTPRLLSGAEQDTVIAELLESYAAGERPGPDWPRDLSEAVATRGFRKEVRELIDRTSEYGVEPGRLEELGEEHLRPEWTAAAVLLQDYRDRLDLGMAEAFDPAGLITTACRLLEENEDLLAAERAALPVLVVDDLQEATPAVHRLVRLLGRGQDVVATASPDTVVQGFRGARPDLVGDYPECLVAPVPPAARGDRPAADGPAGGAGPGDGGLTLALATSHRLGDGVLAAWQRVARRIPALPGQDAVRQGLAPRDGAGTGDADAARDPAPDARAPVPAAGPAGGAPDASPAPGASVHLVASPAHEQHLVLQQLLHLHHREGIPLGRMAVIARSGPLVAELGRFLEAEGVPVNRSLADTVLKTEPAVTPLLALLRLAASPGGSPDAAPDLDEALWLAGGRYGGATALHVRQLRQRLLRDERARGGTRSSADLLLAALEDPGSLDGHRVAGAGLQRIARMLAAGRQAAADPAATAETVLWALWSASDRPARWEHEAVAGTGPDSRRADHDLDAVVGLFQAAERYVDQFPGASALSFADYMEAQDVPMDVLAPAGAHEGSVSVLTPATAAGLEWDAVIIAGLQEGIWPNTRLRGQLLGATDLADVVSGRATVADRRSRLAEVRQDELRSFSTAVSRARRLVVGIAVASDDAQPSDFLDLLSPWRDLDHPRPLTEVPPPITAAALVARLRRRLEEDAVAAGDHGTEDPGADDGRGPGPRREARTGAAAEAGARPGTAVAAAALARLAEEGIRGADPAEWWGLLPLSTTAPLVDTATTPVPVSPSRVQTALESPLNWFLYQAGAQAGSTQAQSLGTLIHAVAEAHPDGPAEALVAEFERRLPDLGLEPGWEADRLRAEAVRMLEYFVSYLRQMEKAGRTRVHVEHRFHQELERDGLRVRINGSIDRLERDAEGRPVVIDLKTGRNEPTQADLRELPQLGVYQAAIAAGALAAEEFERPTEPGGAALVQLRTKNKSVKVQEQPALSADEQWALDQVFTAAASMVGPRFLAVHGGPDGPGCALPAVCPIHSDGRQATEWHR
ncbi:ATP-dependent helicase [Citricoccus sp. SGAir0253]|uniref:ATP-dependent helicase n=1 Tax=Citricoccus sp. SGAir0253 TaxID=2567881 RepID=UPI0010CD4BD9|nr:PD-(D/E)XK nuclease family protein [Citricoccus sp. SGAir0253]QCU77724.1 ATP-dependent helicase [Citricoccus sp. SGAir0253]